MPIGWVNVAPVYKLDSTEEAKVELTALKGYIASWGTTKEGGGIGGVPDRPEDSQVEQPEWNLWPKARKKWLTRLEQSLGLIEDMIDELGDEEVYVYKVGGITVGCMFLSPSDTHVHIEYLVTHPGTDGAGGVLIERAVQRSCELGLNGVVRLCWANKNSKKMYEHMGFGEFAGSANTPDNFELKPAEKSDKWQPVGGGSYQYKSNIGQYWAR